MFSYNIYIVMICINTLLLVLFVVLFMNRWTRNKSAQEFISLLFNRISKSEREINIILVGVEIVLERESIWTGTDHYYI